MARPARKELSVLTECLHCKKEIRSYYSSPRKYCSKKCLSLHIRRDQKCKTCNKELKSPRSHNRKYCSRECVSIGKRLESGYALRNEAVATYQRHARNRSLVWELNDIQIDALFGGECYWCGCPPSNKRLRKRSHGMFIYNGIDRVENNIGYIEGNVVSCCFMCNSMKRDFNKDAFIDKIKSIAEKWK